MAEEEQRLITRLFEIGAVKFGEFKLKSGITSPIYIDLRIVPSFPDILTDVARVMHARLGEKPGSDFDVVCGVPYTALPIATVLCVQNNWPMVMRRKERKEYGTGNLVEGVYSPGARVLVVEDILTSGASILETIADLKGAGLAPTRAVVLVDREQGGRANVEAQGYRVDSVVTLPRMLEVLSGLGKLEPDVVARTREFLAANSKVAAPGQAPAPAPAPAAKPPAALTLAQRAEQCPHPVAKRLFGIMQAKRSNLSFNPDVTSAAEVLRLTDLVGPEICMLKTHVDVIEDFTPEFVSRLQALARKHDFVIFEDRKFADIGNTVKDQFAAGVYKISSWADVTNAHLLPGPGIIDGLKQVAKASGRDIGLLLLAEMSSKGNLCTGAYTEAVVQEALRHPDFVMGFISMRKVAPPSAPGLLHITPGVQLQEGGDGLGQQFATPASVIGKADSDIIQVGRGIFGAADPAAEARKYREAGWAAYEQKVAPTA